MAYQTPPDSGRKKGLLGRSAGLPYYEDVRGKVNSDEEFDRFPDECEEESSSEDDRSSEARQEETSRGFFKAFATPRSSRHLESRRFQRSSQGTPGTQGVNNIFKHFSGPRRASSSIISSSIDTSSPSAQKSLRGLSKDEDEPPDPIRDERPVPKKLIPRKFGMFGSQKRDSTAILQDSDRKSAQRNKMSSFFEEAMASFDDPTANVPEAIMDDLLKSGGLYNFEDSFPTLEDANSSEGALHDSDSPKRAPAANSPSDNRIEDAIEPATNNFTAINAKQSDSKKTSTELVAVRQKRTRSPAAQPAKRKSTRREIIQAAKKATETHAGRRANVQHANEKTSDLKVTNHGKMTARAASLRSKSQARKGVASKVMNNSARKLQRKAKRVKADRNWKGEKIDVAGGIVVVLTDEEDADQYVRY